MRLRQDVKASRTSTHFSTPCTKTSKKKKAAVTVKKAASKSSCVEVLLKSTSRKVSTLGECKQSCVDIPACKYTKFNQKGWCTQFGTSCAETLNLNSNFAMFEREIERDTDLALLNGIGYICCLLMMLS